MITKSYDFIITNHARERFVERFSEDRKKTYAHLSTCKNWQGCQRCVDLVFKLKKEVDESRHYLDKVICARLHTAHETRIHHNNHNFMTKMREKYGDRPAHYLISDDILFLVVDALEGKVCVTCMDVRDSILGDFARRPKYRKKQADLLAV